MRQDDVFTAAAFVFNHSGTGSMYYNTTVEMNSTQQIHVIEVTWLEVFLIIVVVAFMLCIIIGNIFVILSAILFRDMRTMTNGLIVSLATADILVAILVLPISLHHEVVGVWTLGPYVCDFWITADVFCCTSSILNIVAIALDRYWLITRNISYTHNSNFFTRYRTCLIMVFLAWVSSAIISSSPLFGWKRGDEGLDPTQCIISQDIGYTIFSTFGAFWFPLFVILVVYLKIFRVAQRRAKKRAKARTIHPSLNSAGVTEPNGKHISVRYTRASDSVSPNHSPVRTPVRLCRRRDGAERRRLRAQTRNSARTLGLIIGGFILCWFPFFLTATILPFCASCEVPPIVMSIVLWLGYSNSLLNPAIYAIWDKGFRKSFKRLATCDIRWTTIL